jgi:transposase-like protein
MAKHRTYSVEFKRQVVQDYLTGETLHGLAKRHDVSRNLIRIWIAKHEAGALDSDTAAAKVLTEYEARIAALERLRLMGSHDRPTTTRPRANQSRRVGSWRTLPRSVPSSRGTATDA